MSVLLELVLLSTPDADLADRLAATYQTDPEAAAEAVLLLAHDDRVELLSRPSLVARDGKPAELVIGKTVPVIASATPGLDGELVYTYRQEPAHELAIDVVPFVDGDEVVVDLRITRDLRPVEPDARYDGAWRFGAGDVLHYAMELVADDGRYTAITEGDLTVIARALVAPTDEDVAELQAAAQSTREAVESDLPKTRRAIRRAVDDLLVD